MSGHLPFTQDVNPYQGEGVCRERGGGEGQFAVILTSCKRPDDVTPKIVTILLSKCSFEF